MPLVQVVKGKVEIDLEFTIRGENERERALLDLCRETIGLVCDFSKGKTQVQIAECNDLGSQLNLFMWIYWVN